MATKFPPFVAADICFYFLKWSLVPTTGHHGLHMWLTQAHEKSLKLRRGSSVSTTCLRGVEEMEGCAKFCFPEHLFVSCNGNFTIMRKKGNTQLVLARQIGIR